ncbi:hypothetical protein [Paracoccus sp. MC1854]|uniref:hypothetical protein n=1 Tax=Paracoccus sp. MC1854 TaxID=2760306 RepID=UPI002107D4CF|nr:hypothetical protein [Paracoccus sp. MC1854]
MHIAGAAKAAALRRMGQRLCLVLVLGASPALAAEWTPPQGCRLDLTVQQRSCTVAQHYRCEGDAPGDQWVAYFTDEGLVSQSRIDAETRWMESTDLVSGITDRLDPDARDHASLSTLLQTGSDDFDFWTRSDSGERLRHIGRDDLTGTVEIDGETLDTTRFNLRTFAESGELLIERNGSQFVSRELGRFFGGAETSTDWTGEAQETNDSPVRFIRRGEAGFGGTTPDYDCNMQMVGMPAGGGA